MDFLIFLAIAIISYLGLLIGIIIALMTKEELNPYRKYFLQLHNIVLAFALLFAADSIKINPLLRYLLPLLLIIFLSKYNKIYQKSYYSYIFLGVIFFISSKFESHFLIIASLVLFYGFLISALKINIKEKNYCKILLQNSTFFICLFLYFIFAIL